MAQQNGRDTAVSSLTAETLASLMTSMKSLWSGSASSKANPPKVVMDMGDLMEHSSCIQKTHNPRLSPDKELISLPFASRGPGYRSGKSIAIGMDYGVMGNQHLIDDYLATVHGGLKNLGKKDYEKLATAVKEIDAALRQMLLMGRPDAAAISEMVAARIGLALAQENKKFDSWRWAAACKGEKSE